MSGGVLFAAATVIIVGGAMAIGALALIAVGGITKRRRLCMDGYGLVAGLLAAAALALLPNPPSSFLSRVSNLIEVVTYRGALQQQVLDLTRQGISPTVAEIAVDGFGSLTTGIAYDPTGEILLPKGQQSAQWKAVADRTELGVDGLEARHIVGGYYRWFHP